MITVTTNNQPRQLIYGYELPENKRADFDYIPEDEFEFHDFVKYKDEFYDMDEIMRIPNDSGDLKDWDGYVGQSTFDCILVKLVDDESVIVGHALW